MGTRVGQPLPARRFDECPLCGASYLAESAEEGICKACKVVARMRETGVCTEDEIRVARAYAVLRMAEELLD